MQEHKTNVDRIRAVFQRCTSQTLDRKKRVGSSMTGWGMRSRPVSKTTSCGDTRAHYALASLAEPSSTICELKALMAGAEEKSQVEVSRKTPSRPPLFTDIKWTKTCQDMIFIEKVTRVHTRASARILDRRRPGNGARRRRTPSGSGRGNCDTSWVTNGVAQLACANPHDAVCARSHRERTRSKATPRNWTGGRWPRGSLSLSVSIFLHLPVPHNLSLTLSLHI